MKSIVLFFFILLSIGNQCKADSICEIPIQYKVIANNYLPDSFVWIAGERKYNVYYKGAEFIVENTKKKGLKLIESEFYFHLRHNEEIAIDTISFKNVGDGEDKEILVHYSTFSLDPAGGGSKAHYLMALDTRSWTVIFNISTYESKFYKDENGREFKTLYEATIEIGRNHIHVRTSEESDVDRSALQLDDGLYRRHGHCYVKQ
jgi:hypothetical protein